MARHRTRYRLEGLRRQDRGRCQPVEARVRRLRMMHGPIKDQNDRSNVATGRGPVAAFERALVFCNNVIVVLAALALIAACLVLSHSVLTRALFHSPNYWRDEAAAFLLAGPTFMTAAHVPQPPGHIGIQAVVGLPSPIVNPLRLVLPYLATI